MTPQQHTTDETDRKGRNRPTRFRRVLPTLQYSVMCLESIYDGSAFYGDPLELEFFGHEHFSVPLAGVATPRYPFSTLTFLTLPGKIDTFEIINRWEYGIGKFQQEIEIFDPTGAILIETCKQDFMLPDLHTSGLIRNWFADMEFQEAGTYPVKVYIDSKLAIEYPLTVVVSPRD